MSEQPPRDLLTAAEAAEILGMTDSGVWKLIQRGELERRAYGYRRHDSRGIVDRTDVEQLAAVRLKVYESEQQRRAQARDLADDAPGQRFAPPDDEHEWLGLTEVAGMLGITTQAIAKRCRKGTIPAVRVGRKWWVRADHARIAANVRATNGPETVAITLEGVGRPESRPHTLST